MIVIEALCYWKLKLGLTHHFKTLSSRNMQKASKVEKKLHFSGCQFCAF